MRDNVHATGGTGVVIGTEYEPEKARAARAHFEQAGLSRFIDLREGDLRETLKRIDGPVDFMLVDIWIIDGATGVAAGHPASASRAPSWSATIRSKYRSDYADYFAFLKAQWLPDHDAAIRRRPGIVGVLPDLKRVSEPAQRVTLK